MGSGIVFFELKIALIIQKPVNIVEGVSLIAFDRYAVKWGVVVNNERVEFHCVVIEFVTVVFAGALFSEKQNITLRLNWLFLPPKPK